MLLTKGTRLGPHEITALLGVGGMGKVYRARNTKLGRDVAIKMLPDSFARDVERLARFDWEARILGALNHPHISASVEEAEVLSVYPRAVKREWAEAKGWLHAELSGGGLQ